MQFAALAMVLTAAIMVKEARSIPICNIETNDLVKCHPAFTGIETTRHLRDLTVAHWSEPLIYNAFARTSLISPGLGLIHLKSGLY
ncbi:unnamed protein product [Arabidopsis thaliana]|nr:unnamed protein product [Arabidopsis thaliana]